LSANPTVYFHLVYKNLRDDSEFVFKATTGDGDVGMSEIVLRQKLGRLVQIALRDETMSQNND